MSAILDYGIAPPGYRLPEGTRVGRVRLRVSSLARSLEFYQRVLGMRVIASEEGHAILGAHGDDTPLVELHERPGARAVPRRGLVGLYHFAILLPDRAALGRFLLHLARVGAHAGMSDHFVSEAIYLQDPDNLGIEVYADRPRDAWRTEGRELSMSTVPLDTQSLAAAAGNEAWTGMPAGTVMGHVHLHVGDIDAGARFYHEALGFDKVVWSYPGALFLSAGGYHHHLGTNTWAAGAGSPGDDDAQLLEWELLLPTAGDVERAGASLRAAGVEVVGGGAGLVARDPWGTAVRILAA